MNVVYNKVFSNGRKPVQLAREVFAPPCLVEWQVVKAEGDFNQSPLSKHTSFSHLWASRCLNIFSLF